LKSRPPVLIAAATLVCALSVVAVLVATSASARTSTITFHFFEKAVSFKITDAAGNPITPGANFTPAVGDVFVSTNLDYVGNHKHHAKKYTATDHVRCVFETAPTATNPMATALCDGQIAIGGSMLLADQVTATLTQTTTAAPINGGIGKYAGYHGTAKAVGIDNTNNSDFTIRVHK
jgi:hypothetical protein